MNSNPARATPRQVPAGSVAQPTGSAPQALPLLDIRDLTRAVGGRWLVDHVSLQIPRGEVLAIVGPSGSGKSSFRTGSDPVYAAIYQFVVVAVIYAASGLAALGTISIVRRRVFSSAEQLILRPALLSE